MEIVVNLIILLVVVQTALRLSQWPKWWPRLLYLAVVAAAVCLSADWASNMSKPMMEAWLHDTSVLQDVAVVCLLDALLSRLRWYPGLLMLPVAFYLLCQLLFAASGLGFLSSALLLAVAWSLLFVLLVVGMLRLLPERADRTALHLIVTVMLCVISLVATQQTVMVYPVAHQNIIMEYISKVLFGIANILLIPDIILLIFFFIRSLVLLATTWMQYSTRRRDGYSPLYAKYRAMLYDHDPDEAYADYLAAQLEADGAKDVNLSRLLTKVGPVLGLIGTLISMSPALVGLSKGDISGMAYNMQVVFSSTVVGLVISIVGLFTQQLKSRWYQQDVSRLDYVSHQYIEHHEKEA